MHLLPKKHKVNAYKLEMVSHLSFSKRLYHPAQQVQQSTVPPPPVVPAQVLTLIPAQPQVVQQVQPTSAQTVHHQLQQLPPQLAAQHPSVLPPQGPQIQQQGPAVAGQVPTAVHSIGTQPAGVVQPSTIPANIQQPGNPVLHRALIQAMAQQGNMGSVTMDDVGNLLLTSGRASVHYHATHASDDFQKQFQKR